MDDGEGNGEDGEEVLLQTDLPWYVVTDSIEEGEVDEEATPEVTELDYHVSQIK